jgi:hypothetical protein
VRVIVHGFRIKIRYLKISLFHISFSQVPNAFSVIATRCDGNRSSYVKQKREGREGREVVISQHQHHSRIGKSERLWRQLLRVGLYNYTVDLRFLVLRTDRCLYSRKLNYYPFAS